MGGEESFLLVMKRLKKQKTKQRKQKKNRQQHLPNRKQQQQQQSNPLKWKDKAPSNRNEGIINPFTPTISYSWRVNKFVAL